MKYISTFLLILYSSYVYSQTAYFCSNSQFGNRAWCYQQTSFDDLNVNQDDYLSSDELLIGNDSNKIEIGQLVQTNEAWFKRAVLAMPECKGTFDYYDLNQNGRFERIEYEKWQANMELFAKEKAGWRGYDPLKDRYVCLTKAPENSSAFTHCVGERFRENMDASELFVTALEKKYHVACYKE